MGSVGLISLDSDNLRKSFYSLYSLNTLTVVC